MNQIKFILIVILFSLGLSFTITFIKEYLNILKGNSNKGVICVKDYSFLMSFLRLFVIILMIFVIVIIFLLMLPLIF